MKTAISAKTFRPAAFRKSKLADRGKSAEDAVHDYLEAWAARDVHREASKLVDSKAAGRTIKAAAADFEFFMLNTATWHGLIEVKETQHEYRLDRSRLTQAPRLRKRSKCGGSVFVLVYHSMTRQWRCLTALDLLDPSAKGSWDLRDRPAFPTCGEALVWASGLWRELK